MSPGGQLRIPRAFRPLADDPLHFEDVLVADVTGRFVGFRCDLRVEDDLRQPVAVAQIDEDEPTEVTPPVDPAPQA